MNLLIAPDSLKDSISSIEFCKIIKKLINDNWPKDNVTILPLADGGEGTVDAIIYSTSGKFIKKRVTGPLGNKIEAKYGLLSSGKTAIIEMASASGLQLVPLDKRNPMITTTYGTGELILDAINKGVKKIIISIGGSATNDAGIGMMQALGYKCLDIKKKMFHMAVMV